MTRRLRPLLDPARWDPRGRTAPTPARILFWTTIGLIVLLRGFFSHLEGQFVPATFEDIPFVYLVALACLVPTVLLWPLLPWHRQPSAREMAATVGFTLASLAVFAVTEFGHYFLLATVAAQATSAFGLLGGVLSSGLFGVVNFAIQYSVTEFTVMMAASNSAAVAVSGLIICFVVAGLVTAARRAQHTRALLTDLERAHRDLEDTHRKLRHYTTRTRELAVAEERSRMAREMHDSTGHHLTAINVCLANAERGGPVPDQVREDIGEARQLAKQALEETRRWVRALKPLDLEGRTGAEAVGTLVEAFADTGARTRFRLEGSWPETMDAEAELAVYRATQEGLTNALRHSRAGNIDVTSQVIDDAVTVEISDDGVGADETAAGSGFGLTARVPREVDPSLESVS